MLKKIIASVLAISMLCGGFVFSVYAESDEEKQYIVKLKPADVRLMSSAGNEDFSIVDEETLERLLDENAVERYEEDYSVELFDDTASVIPAKKYDAETKWDLAMIDADMLYDIHSTGQNVKIAVIDSGVASHDDLSGNVLTGYNYLDNSTDTKDAFGHGTFVSGIIASLDDGKGIVGASPDAKIVPLKCFDQKTTNVSVICRAIYGAVDDYGCKVINMSFGLAEDSEFLRKAIDYAAQKGVIMVAAVGNYGKTDLLYPAAYENVIGVGAVDKDGKVSDISQHNQSVFVTAPGVNVISTSHKDKSGYVAGTGTSYAAPFVTAAAAALLSIDEGINAQSLKEILSRSAVDKGDEGYDEYYGYGILNLKNCAVNAMGDILYYISPAETVDEKNSFVIYNNSNKDFSGLFFGGQYNGKEMKTLTTKDLTVSAGKTAAVQTDLSEYSEKYFVWSSLENNAVVSNMRNDAKEEKTEEIEEQQITVSVDLSKETGEKYFSLLAFGSDNTVIYAVQDKIPENGIYEWSLPQKNIIAEDDNKKLCEVSVSVMVNGEKKTVPAAVHEFEDNVVAPTKTDKGYTEHICKNCGYKYSDSETEPIGYFVTYDANGGENAPDKQNKRPETELSLTEAAPVRVGYTFLGWSSDKDSDNPEYTAGASYTADEDITLYAVWKVNTYKLIYTVDNTEYKMVEVKYGDKITAENNPSKSGYTFSGWQNLPDAMPAEDVTVTGTFTRKSSGGGGGGGSSSSSKASSSASTVKSQESVKSQETVQSQETSEQKPDLNIPEEKNYTVELFSFSDVNKNDWFYKAVSEVVAKGIVSGTSDTTYEPEGTLTRAMFAVMLHRYAGEPVANYAMSYSDLQNDMWYTEAVRWASSTGIVKGYDDNTFRPDESITREQAAAVLKRYAEFVDESNPLWNETNILSYKDADSISEWAADSIRWAVGAGVMKGKTDETIDPKVNITRAEIAQMLVNYMSAVENYKADIKK